MSEQVQPSRGRKNAKKPFTSEEARAAVLAKLEEKGTKGVPSFVTAKTPADKKAAFEQALASLEEERELFVDRRTVKPKYFLWAHRPKLPTAETVAAAMEEHVSSLLPMLLTEAELKKALGKSKESAPFFDPALELLLSERRLIRLKHQPAKKLTEFLAPTASLRRMLGEPEPAVASPASVPRSDITPRVQSAYGELAKRTGFPAVPISTLQRECGVALEELKRWLLDRYHRGEAVFSLGDWSLASEEKRAGAIELNGDRYLLVQLT